MASYNVLVIPNTSIDALDQNKAAIYANAYIWDAATGVPYVWPEGIAILQPLSFGPILINAFTDPSQATYQAIAAAFRASPDAPPSSTFSIKILGVPGRL